MLKHLIRYEFKATSRTYGGLYLALLVVAALLGLSARLDSGPATMWDTAALVLTIVYGALCAAIAVITILQIIDRFQKNLMGREGYLMHTLPVTESQLIVSKLLTSVVWAVCGVAVGLLSMVVLCCTAALNGAFFAELNELFSALSEAWKRMDEQDMASLGLLFQTLLAWVVLFLSWGICLVLRIYASCMVGHQFKKHPTAAGILAFFVLSTVQGWLADLLDTAGVMSLSITVGSRSDAPEQIALLGNNLMSHFSTSGMLWLSVLVTVAVYAVFGAGYFYLTVWLMKHRLDLE